MNAEYQHSTDVHMTVEKDSGHAPMSMKQLELRASIAEEMNPQKRNTMEDCHIFFQPGTWMKNHSSNHTAKNNFDKLAYVGVYDGHGGRDTVDFLQDALHECVAEELNHVDVVEDSDVDLGNDGDDGNNNKNTDSAVNHVSMETRLERAFLITDVMSQMDGIQTSGATVAICLIQRDFEKQRVVIHAANAGDGRAVLSCTPTNDRDHDHAATSTMDNSDNDSDRDSSFHTNPNATVYKSTQLSKAYRLTRDHKADDASEIQRIENAGGFLMRQRVLGIMAVARSLGDAGLKEYVIAKPYCQSIDIPLSSIGKEDQFVICACDGLWDTMSDQEAVDLVRFYITKENNFIDELDEVFSFSFADSKIRMPVEALDMRQRRDYAAHVLCKEAMARGSADNITVIVVWL